MSPEGFTAPGLDRLRDTFETILNEPCEVGGAFSVSRGGRMVVDLWGGRLSERADRPWRQDTIQMIFSGSKGICAILFLVLLDREVVDIDQRVSDIWPEFAANGKGEFTIRDVLNHRVGLPAFDVDVEVHDLADERQLAALLARQKSLWPRTSARLTYHPLTFGTLLAEIVRRLLGRSIGEVLESEIVTPLGLDLRIGALSDAVVRCAELHPTQAFIDEFDALLATSDVLSRAYGNPSLFQTPLIWNAPDYLAYEIPAINACGSARSIAALYADVCQGANGTSKLLSSARRVEQMVQADVEDLDPHAPALEDLVGAGASQLRFAQGFELQTSLMSFGPSADAFGHTGAGGSVHGAWPALGIGFSFCTNTLRPQAADDRAKRLLATLHEAVVGP
jgi:CubicO group peptidase (beta-lactamase class C family)